MQELKAEKPIESPEGSDPVLRLMTRLAEHLVRDAGAQTARLTRALNTQLLRAGREGRLSKMPPVLAFQSLVDTTVSSPAVAPVTIVPPIV